MTSISALLWCSSYLKDVENERFCFTGSHPAEGRFILSVSESLACSPVNEEFKIDQVIPPRVCVPEPSLTSADWTSHTAQGRHHRSVFVQLEKASFCSRLGRFKLCFSERKKADVS